MVPHTWKRSSSDVAWNRLRGNFLSGQVADNPLLVGATTFTSPGLASLPVVANGDYMTIVFDPSGSGGSPEIAYVTAHTLAATSATILRAQEGTGARQHAATTVWINSPTAYDFRGANQDHIWYKSTAANVLDDEFADGVLDPAFVRVDNPSSAHLTWTETEGCISALHTGTDAAAGYHALLKPHGGNFAIGNYVETCTIYNGLNTSSPMAGIMVTDGVTNGAGAQILCATWNNSTAPYQNLGIRRGVNFNTDNANAGNFAVNPGRVYLRLHWVAANSFRTLWSRDGISWLAMVGNTSYTCTPTHIGFFITSWGSTTDFAYPFEYLRVI